jgi:hypothetical protein
MLLAARVGRRRRRRSRCWRLVKGQHPDLPSIALTIVNHSPIGLGFGWAAGLALSSRTPFSGCPQRIAIRAYHVRGIPIELGHMGFVVPPLVHVFVPFLNSLPTIDWSPVRHKHRVLREERGDGGWVVVGFSLVIRITNREDLLSCLWVGRVCLLSKGRLSKADCQPY